MSFYRNKRKDQDDDFIDDEDAERDESSEEEKSARNKKTTRKKSRTDVEAEKKIDPETGITACTLSKYRKVVVRQFKKMILIDIRQYFGKDEDEMKPTKKGISLSLDQWKVLSQNVDKVDEVIQEMS